MSFSFSSFEAALKGGAAISADDVRALRGEVWPDGTVSEAEAEAVFELNRMAGHAAPEWSDFFLEAMGEYVVDGKPPHGYVDETGATWLIGQIERDGHPITGLELELVVKVLEKALNCPPALKAWALARIEGAVLSGEGPTRDGPARPGTIDEAEVRLLRRIVFAAAGDGALTIGADEAEMLWRLKDACRAGENADGWKTLFVQAVGNHLMAYSSYRPLERAEAVRLEAFFDDHSSSPLGFFRRMIASRGEGAVDAIRAALNEDRTAPQHDAAVDAARAITPDESKWLQAHIDADGARDALEQALLDFIAEETAQRPS